MTKQMKENIDLIARLVERTTDRLYQEAVPLMQTLMEQDYDLIDIDKEDVPGRAKELADRALTLAYFLRQAAHKHAEEQFQSAI